MPEGDCLCLKEISIRCVGDERGKRWAYNQHVQFGLWVWVTVKSCVIGSLEVLMLASVLSSVYY